MSFVTELPFAIGKQDTGDTGKLGSLYIGGGGKIYRLVKATSAIATPQGKVVVDSMSSGARTWSVATSTTAGDQFTVGVIPSDYGTTTIAASALFWVQVSGEVTGLIAATATTSGMALAASTAGTLAAQTAWSYTVKVCGFYAGTAAVTAAGEDGPVQLTGIL